MAWWQWLALGLVLVGLEMAAAGGFYVIFFGIAAIVIAGLRLVDIAGPTWVQLLLFSVLSVASLLVFRHRILRLWAPPDAPADVDTVLGQTAMTLEDIESGAVGRVELRGTVWSARNATPTMIEKGRRCIVTRTDRLMLFIKPEEAVS
jgi:membrane protein implicated in regulation of membrane protease activity